LGVNPKDPGEIEEGEDCSSSLPQELGIAGNWKRFQIHPLFLLGIEEKVIDFEVCEFYETATN